MNDSTGLEIGVVDRPLVQNDPSLHPATGKQSPDLPLTRFVILFEQFLLKATELSC